MIIPKGKWNAVAIQRILNNRVYIGDTVQGVSEKISFKSKKTRRLPKSTWCITEKTHIPIIDTQIFDNVQMKMKSKNSQFSNTYKKNPNSFTGLIFCGKCGSVMYARKRTNRPMGYVCANYLVNGSKACESHFVREDELFTILAEEFSQLMGKIDCIQGLSDQINTPHAKDKNLSSIEKKEKQLEEKIRQQEELYMDKLEGKVSAELFFRVNNSIEEQIQKIKEKIIEKEKDSFTIDIKTCLSEILQKMESNEFSYEMVQLMIQKIIIYNQGECLPKPSNGDNTLKKNTTGAIVVEFKY